MYVWGVWEEWLSFYSEKIGQLFNYTLIEMLYCLVQLYWVRGAHEAVDCTCLSVCACVRACVHACVRACVRVCMHVSVHLCAMKRQPMVQAQFSTLYYVTRRCATLSECLVVTLLSQEQVSSWVVHVCVYCMYISVGVVLISCHSPQHLASFACTGSEDMMILSQLYAVHANV